MNEEDRQRLITISATLLGRQLRTLAHHAGDFVRLTDELLLATPVVPSTPDWRRQEALEEAADVLAAACERYRSLRDLTHHLRDGEL